MSVVCFVGVTKVYPPELRALDNVTVSIDAGEIHAFVGENGAGKSTLMKVLNGEVRPDAGTVEVFGAVTSYRSAHDAMEAGVGMVHQEILLVDELTTWENVVLGNEPMCALQNIMPDGGQTQGNSIHEPMSSFMAAFGRAA